MNNAILTFLMIFAGMSSAQASNGQCRPGPYTPDYQAPFCRISTEEQHCGIIGCAWVQINYTCRPGDDTLYRDANKCFYQHNRRDCMQLRCDWVKEESY